MKLVIILAAALALTSLAPIATAAEPECIQVHPWSELCEGDIPGFLCGMQFCFELACERLRECIGILDPVCPGGPPCPPDPTLA